MAEVRLSPAAQGDLDAIFEFTVAHWGVQQALRYVQDIAEACRRLAEQPDLGLACDHIRAGYRSWRVTRHRSYFRREDFGIAVVRILHERMDVGTRLR
ncbi:MAG: type II toxin-antitoxin system RelE/ParE family toxin [Burkholderiales bacterium]|nr:MAG: type II toxin-antitoxin system RelE/ParE family toxin [Burkholderiales bacterium]